MYRRYTSTIDKFSIVSYQLRNVDKFLNTLNVKENSKFVVIGDRTVNGSLVLLNKFGWTYPDFGINLSRIEDNLIIADYLIILSPSTHQVPIKIKSRLSNCDRFTYYSNYIFDLKSYKKGGI
jgi:hypothetical protein